MIPLGFERTSYTFNESDIFVNDTVFVTKGDLLSEQVLMLLVQYSPDSTVKGMLLQLELITTQLIVWQSSLGTRMRFTGQTSL